MRNLIVFSLLAGLSATGDCSTALPGRVSHVASLADGVVVFEQSGERTAQPSCSRDGAGRRWAIDTSTAIGQALFDALLNAQAAKAPIAIVGTGACMAGIGVELLGSLPSIP